LADKPQDESIKDKIIELLGKSYSRIQLTKDFGFAERTVDNAIKEYKKQHGDDRGEGKEAAASSARNDALALRKSGESVLPEWLETDVAQIFNGDLQDQRIFLAGMSVPLMGLRLFAEGVKPIIDLLATWQEGQTQAARAAQGSSIEVAHAAAEEAALRVGQQVQETARQAATAGSPNPMASMVSQTIQPHFADILSRMFSMLGGIGQPPGAIPNQPDQPPQQNPPQGQTPVSTPGAEQVSEQKMKEVFGDD